MAREGGDPVLQALREQPAPDPVVVMPPELDAERAARSRGRRRSRRSVGASRAGAASMPAMASTTRSRDVLRGEPDVGQQPGRAGRARGTASGSRSRAAGSVRRASRSGWATTDPTPPDPAVVLDGDDQPVPRRRRSTGSAGERLDPARVDDRDADALVGQPLGDLERRSRHRPDRDDQDVRVAGAVQHVHAAPAFERGEVGGHRALREAQHRRGVVDRRRASRSSSRSVARVARRGEPQARARPAGSTGPTCRGGEAPSSPGDPGAVEHERHAGPVQRDSPSAPGRTRG